MLENYLTNNLAKAITKIPYNSLCELRLRQDNPAVVNILGESYYLTNDRLVNSPENAINVSMGDIQSIIQKISQNSLYSINDQLIDGYVSIAGGIRVGVCGEVVCVDGKIKTIKNISSLNFRFPHFLKNCSLNIYPYIVSNNRVRSTLIISPPGAGKTTYIRDLIFQMSNRERLLNILVVDERQEISSVFNGDEYVKLKNVDVCKNSSKAYGFNNGIRSMKPDVIVTDEINPEKDIDIIENALTSGVSVIATMHASSIADLKNKPSFQNILHKKLFERYVVLSSANGVGTCEGVFDENLMFMGV